MLNPLSLLQKDQRGIAAVDFAAIAPAFFLILMGGFDIGHTLYVQSIMHGELQKAARDSSLENGAETTRQAAIRAQIHDALYRLNHSATITIDNQSYATFTDAMAQRPEDANENGICQAGETWIDRNGNNTYDAKGGSAGQGGAKDVVVYTVTMSYPRMFPLAKMIGLSPNVNLTARTVLQNQPFGDQNANAASLTPRNCT